MNAAVYLRSARADQPGSEDASAQRQSVHAFATSRGLKVADLYEDTAVSGLSDPSERPGFARLMVDAAAGRFEIVIVAGLDRISRREAAAFGAIEQLSRLGVRVTSATGEAMESTQ